MQKKKKLISLSAKISILFVAIVMYCTASLAAVCYSFYWSDLVAAQGDKAMNIVLSVVAHIDSAHFQEMMRTGDLDKRYEDDQAFLNKVKLLTGVQYLYVLEKPKEGSDVFRYYAEAALPGETEAFRFGALESVNEFMDDSGQVLITLGEGTPGATKVYSTLQWGRLVSGYAPILDADGNVIGMVGADITIQTIVANSDRFVMAAVISVFVCNIVALVICQIVARRQLRKPLGLISEASRKVANGNIVTDLRIKTNDEIRVLADDFKQISYSLTSLISSVNMMAAEQNKGNTDARIPAEQFSGAYRALAEGINEMVERYLDDTNEMLRVVAEFGNGNFETELRQFPGKKAAINVSVETLRNNLKQVSREISAIVAGATEGKLSTQIDVDNFAGDWKEITIQLNALLQAVLGPIHECSRVLGEMSHGFLDVKMTGLYSGEFEAIKTALNSMSDEISSYIHEITHFLSNMANGVLTDSINRRYVGAFSTIKDAINHILDQFNLIIGNIGESSLRVDDGATRLSSAGSDIAFGAQEQGQAVVELTNAIAGIRAQTEANTANAIMASSLSETAKGNAYAGNAEMQRMLVSMESIKESSDNISSFINTIEDISFQTTLLALNAAVEAARAGQHGKGFGVVAEQVRALAERSKHAVSESALLLEDSRMKVDEGRNLAHQTAERLSDIVSNVDEVAALISEISKASDTQLQSVAGIDDGLQLISRAAQNNQEASEESAVLSEQLARQASDLKETVQRFVLRRGGER